MFEIKIKTHFAAAHQLRDYPGDCERLHGHNYGLDIICRCNDLDPLGMGIDFKVLKAQVKSVTDKLDHFNLNEKPFFKDMNPSAENIARWCYQQLAPLISTPQVKLYRVDLWETDSCCASYFE